VAKKARRLFVSHASADRLLAIKLKALLQRALAADVFCSSDVGDIEGGKKWFDEIMDHLKRASVCVAIMTPNSLYFSPWVAYEAGGAYLRFETDPGASRLFPVCAYGLTPGIVPSPFNQLQVRNLADMRELRTLVTEIARSLNVRPRRALRGARDVSTEAAVGSPHWGYVSSALVGQRQQSSPFNFLSMLERATSDVFCAGFNLHHIATSSVVRSKLLSWLKQLPTRSVRLLLSDKANARQFVVLQSVGASYLEHLSRSVQAFRSWQAEGARLKLEEGQLDIRRASFVALTVLAIDPDSPGGQIVLTPAIWGRPLSAERPHFWLSRGRQPGVFAYYWDTYHDLFINHAKPL
jgi:hypothetical protein